VTSLLDFFENTYRPRRLPTGSPATLHHYNTYLRIWSRWLGRPCEVADLTNDTIAAFLCWYGSRRSIYSMDSARNCLLALWRYACLRGLALEPPDLAPLSLPQYNPQAWTLEDLGRLLAAPATWRPTPYEVKAYLGVPPDLWWRAYFLVAYDTGFRRTALAALRWDDLSRCALTARAAFSKTKRDECRSLAPDTLTALRDIREPERATIFAWLGSDARYYRHFGRILTLAGLPATCRDKTQKLRRTSATAVAAAFNRTAAQHHLGHQSLATTERHYLDASQLPTVNTAAALPRPTTRPTLRVVG
jgi:integrase